MKKTALLLFCIFFLKSSFAQNYTKKYSSLSFANSAYHTGNKSGSYATNDNGSIYTSNIGNNLTVCKLYNTGCIEWSLDYNFGTDSRGSIIKQLSDGNYLVCGSIGYETVAMKIDGTGTVIWSKKYNALDGVPLDFAQKGNEIIILAGYGQDADTTNKTLLKIDETNGTVINSKEINRAPLAANDSNLICRFNRILSTSNGYVLGGYTYMNKNINDPLEVISYSFTPIIAYLDMAGNIIDGRYFTEGRSVKEIIQTSSGELIVAIHNDDYKYLSAIPNSTSRLSIFKVSNFGILWQKMYVSPRSAVSYVANHIPNNMEFTTSGDILIAGFVDQGLTTSVPGAGNYIFKINANGNLLTDLKVFNNTMNMGQGVTGLKITPANDFVMNMYTGGITRFTSNLSTSLCDYISVPIDEFTETLTSMLPTGMVEINTPINAVPVTPTITLTNPVVTSTCGTTCPDCCIGGNWISKSIDWSIINHAGTISTNLKDKVMNDLSNPKEKDGVSNPLPTSLPITNCDAIYHLSQNSTYTFNASYQCGVIPGQNCSSMLKVKIEGINNNALDGIYNMPYTQTFANAESYKITYYAYCGNKVCESCTFILAIDRNCCLGSKWISKTYTKTALNNSVSAPANLLGLLDSPVGLKPVIYAGKAVNVNLKYACGSCCGNATYRLIQKDISVSPNTTIVNTVINGSASIYTYSKPTRVWITPLCDGKPCGDAVIFDIGCNNKFGCAKLGPSVPTN